MKHLLLPLLLSLTPAIASAAEIRLGIIGLDTHMRFMILPGHDSVCTPQEICAQ